MLRLYTCNYEVKRSLTIGNYEEKIELMKDELGGKIMKEFVAQRPKMYSYATDDGSVNKKAKGAKKCVIKQEIKFQDYKSVWKIIR